ncbi:MAG: sulfite exporter TauE/SafE family protein [Solirubrobacteraceae bacterium]
MTDVLAVLAIGFVAGMAAGLLGIGGGALFVPALVLFLGLSQLEAQATSLLAIVPVALVGAARQHRYGNLRVRDGLVMGVLATAGAAGGVVLANALPERALEISFAMLQFVVAAQLARRALAERTEEKEQTA